MLMISFGNLTDAKTAVMDFRADHFDALPLRLRARFKELSASPSPVDVIVGVGEFIWANRQDVGDEAKLLAASLIAYATVWSYHSMDVDDRGNRIVRNLQMEVGEVETAPEAPDAAPGYRIEAETPAIFAAPAVPPAAG
jgi:hypothetical protein